MWKRHLPVPPGCRHHFSLSSEQDRRSYSFPCAVMMVPRPHPTPTACSPDHHQPVLPFLYFSPRQTSRCPMPTLFHCPVTLLDLPFPTGAPVLFLSLPDTARAPLLLTRIRVSFGAR